MAKDKDSYRKVTQAPPPIESVGGRTCFTPRKTKEIDHQLWSKADYWWIEEAAHLLCGINPGFYELPINNPYDGSLEQRINRTYELLKRSYESGELKRIGAGYLKGFAPNDIIEWANKKELEVPSELGELVNLSSSKDSKTKLLPCEPGTKWEDIKIKLISEEIVWIETPQKKGRYSYHELKMVNKKCRDKPKKIWQILKLFAAYSGRLDSSIPEQVKRSLLNDFNIDYYRKLPDYTKRLNKNLKDLFGISDSIFKYHYNKHKAYITKIVFEDRRHTNLSDLNDEVARYEKERSLHDIEAEDIQAKLSISNDKLFDG